MKKNVKQLEKTIEGKEWEEALDKAFKKNQKDIKVDGFRKGQIPKDAFIKKFGIESLFNDAIDVVLNDNFNKIVDESGIISVVRPLVDVTHICDHDVTFNFTFIEKPEVKLGDYSKLKSKKAKIEVTKEEIEEEIKTLRERYADVVEDNSLKLENGLTAVIDFEGKVDGKVLEGGSGTDYPLEIGSKSFIEGFEEGLIGLSAGDETNLDLKFPSEYVEELANKKVEFKVTIKSVKKRVLPELNEDFFKDQGIKDVKTKEEYEEYIKNSIHERKEIDEESKQLDDLLERASDLVEVDLNKEILDYEVEMLFNQYSDDMQMQGINLTQYLGMMGKEIETFKEELRPQAEKRIKARYLLEGIVEEKNIIVPKEEIDAEIERMAKMYGIDKNEFLKMIHTTDVIEQDLKMRKALEVLKK